MILFILYFFYLDDTQIFGNIFFNILKDSGNKSIIEIYFHNKKKCQNNQIYTILNFIKLSSIILIVKEKGKKHLTKDIEMIKESCK